MPSYIPHHFLQANGLDYSEEDIDFFDPNLAYDSPLFLDPFLLKKSSNSFERDLFKRLSDFFLYVYHQSLPVTVNRRPISDIKKLITFSEPEEVYIGYASASNKGKGPGPSFAEKLLNYYLNSAASKFVNRPDAFPNNIYNPHNIELFTDRVGPDNISDLTIQLIKDYLIGYTREQCLKYGVKLKKDLPLENEGYDYVNNEWKGGAYLELPENPRDPGKPVLLIPKRLLRANDDPLGSVQSRFIRVLRTDPELTIKFASLLEKNIDEIPLNTVRGALMEDINIHYKYFKIAEEDRSKSYNFVDDKQQVSADKKYEYYFNNKPLPVKEVKSCDDVINISLHAVKSFKEEYDLGDSWRDAWGSVPTRSDNLMPVPEPAIGRHFRGIANGIFKMFQDVTFESEVGTNGVGFVDFKVIYKNCRVAIELKLLNNAAHSKTNKSPAYIRGLRKQLPFYIKSGNCHYGIYLTGQHYKKESPTWTKTNHDPRRIEIESCLDEVEAEIKASVKDFKDLYYINIDMSPKESASKL